MVENWPWLYKLALLLITGLLTLIANIVTTGVLIAIGLNVQPSLSILSGVVAFLASFAVLWAARPRGRRHLMILSAGTFLATTAALLLITLMTYRLSPDRINFMDRKALVILPFAAALGAWGLVYLLARREGMWKNPPGDGGKK